ncbi:MAG: asparagine--tRNA ligase [Phycisphaerae bacterium]
MATDRTLIRDAVTNVPAGTRITVGGWVRTVRTSKGGFSFVQVNDGSCMANLQVVADKELDNYEQEVVHLTAGTSVLVRGGLVESPAKGQSVELHAEELTVLGPADGEAYPIQPKRHSFEFLRSQAHLRARTNTFGAVARVRSTVSGLIHEFFRSRGFIQVHTPIITPSDCEGAGSLFRVSSGETGGDGDEEFFGRPTYLTVSGQLEAEAYACALGRVYTFGPTFRAENSNTPRHLAEFWMVEPEMAFCDLAGDADLAEEFLKRIFSGVIEHCREDLEFFNKRIDEKLIETLTHVAGSDFVRLSYTEAMDILTTADRQWDYTPRWGADLQTEHERYLTEEKFGGPVVVTDYPAEIKPFYMRVNDDGRTVAAMDVLVPRIGEIIGGSQREERLDVLAERMKQSGLSGDDYWWYLDLRRYGSVPHAGFGLGLERCLQFVTGMANIRDVIPFPRTPRSADF